MAGARCRTFAVDAEHRGGGVLRHDSGTLAEERRTAIAPDPGADDQRQSWPNALVARRPERSFDSQAIPGDADLLARLYLRELRSLRPGQPHGHRGPVRLCAVVFERDLPDPRAGSTIRGADPDLQRTDARGPCASRAVGSAPMRTALR